MTKLDTNLFLDNVTNNQRKLILKDRSISEVVCGSVETLNHLDLSSNQISDLSGLASAFPNLTTLYIPKNNINVSNLGALDSLTSLRCLDISHNTSINYLPRKPFNKLSELQVFIASNCSLNKIKNSINLCKKLNTIILSNNQISELPENILVETGSNLSKFNLSHNLISKFPDFSSNKKLIEINLNFNKISSIDDSIKFATELRILNLAHNQISSFDELAKLQSNRLLIQLNLRGNPICDDEHYEENIKKMFPNLQILDNKKILEKTKIGKRSEKERQNIISRAREFDEKIEGMQVKMKPTEIQEDSESSEKSEEKVEKIEKVEKVEEKIKISKKQSEKISWEKLEESSDSW